MNDEEHFSIAYEGGDTAECARLLAEEPSFSNGVSEDGLPYLLSALHRESHGAPPGMSEVLLEAGAEVDAAAAAALGDDRQLFAIIKKEPSALHAGDAWGMQPLHWAAHCGHVGVVADLLEMGADINAAADSWTALHLATELEHGDVVRLLLERGARRDVRLDEAHGRMTPLEMAEAWGLPEMAELLETWEQGESS